MSHPTCSIALIAILTALVAAGCGRSIVEVDEPLGTSSADNSVNVAKDVANSAAASSPNEPKTAAELASLAPGDDDLIVDDVPRADLGKDEEATPSGDVESQSPAVLREGESIEQRFEDGSIQRRWQVRLMVTYDRRLPWDRQPPDSWQYHGSYEEFYPGGQQLFMQGSYLDGKRHGDWTYWHPNGQIAKKGAYENDQLSGTWTIFREDGTLRREESYRRNQKHGTWTTWHTAQQKATQAEFADGKLHGVRRIWHENGQIASEEPFQHDQPHGLFRRWADDGKELRRVEYVEGKRRTPRSS